MFSISMLPQLSVMKAAHIWLKVKLYVVIIQVFRLNRDIDKKVSAFSEHIKFILR